MDSVVLFFGEATFNEVEQAACKHGFAGGTITNGIERFYLWRHTEEQVRAESGIEELELLRGVLGAEFKSAFQISCRHGADARFALQVIQELMSTFKPSALEDDFGNYWVPEQVARCAQAVPATGIYALRSYA